MSNPKTFILPIAGLLSGTLAAWVYTGDSFLSSLLFFGVPGTIFAIFITIGIYLAYSGKKRRWAVPLFLIISTLGYAVSFWGVLLLADNTPGIIVFFIAGLAGGAIMLMGLKILVSIKWLDILILAILAGLLGWVAIKFDQTIIQNRNYSAENIDESGLYILHILWNTTMAFFIARLLIKKD